MNPIEGQIEIDLYPHNFNQDGKTFDRVKISSSRPLHAAKVFIGKTPQQTLELIPLLFNICGVAQARSALSSIQQSLNLPADPKLELARDMLVQVETAKEHLMRIFLDWPTLFELQNTNNDLPYISQLVAEFKDSLFSVGDAFSLDSTLDLNLDDTQQLITKLECYLTEHVFCTTPDNWLSNKNIDAVRQWSEDCSSIAAQTVQLICQQGWASQGMTDCKQLPELDPNALIHSFSAANAEQFIATPKWQQSCYETTALTRQFDQPMIKSLYQEFDATLITRWLARLVELASIPQQLQTLLMQISVAKSSSPLTNRGNTGLAQVEAARGRLIHRVEIENGLICNYQILAPTEWNFHPEGLIAQSLSSVKSDDENEFKQIADIMINAIDPCVGYQLRIH